MAASCLDAPVGELAVTIVEAVLPRLARTWNDDAILGYDVCAWDECNS